MKYRRQIVLIYGELDDIANIHYRSDRCTLQGDIPEEPQGVLSDDVAREGQPVCMVATVKVFRQNHPVSLLLCAAHGICR